jgi:hypothetical protein
VERLPAGHGGGGDSSPELLVDGEGEKNRIGGDVLRRGEGSGGRRRSYDGETEEGVRRRRRGDDDGTRWHGSPGAAQTGDDDVSAALEQQWGRASDSGEAASDWVSTRSGRRV